MQPVTESSLFNSGDQFYNKKIDRNLFSVEFQNFGDCGTGNCLIGSSSVNSQVGFLNQSTNSGAEFGSSFYENGDDEFDDNGDFDGDPILSIDVSNLVDCATGNDLLLDSCFIMNVSDSGMLEDCTTYINKNTTTDTVTASIYHH